MSFYESWSFFDTAASKWNARRAEKTDIWGYYNRPRLRENVFMGLEATWAPTLPMASILKISTVVLLIAPSMEAKTAAPLCFDIVAFEPVDSKEGRVRYTWYYCTLYE